MRRFKSLSTFLVLAIVGCGMDARVNELGGTNIVARSVRPEEDYLAKTRRSATAPPSAPWLARCSPSPMEPVPPSPRFSLARTCRQPLPRACPQDHLRRPGQPDRR